VTDPRTDTPSVVERTRAITTEVAAVAAHFLGEIAVFVLGEAALLLVARDGQARSVAVHNGAILCSAAADDRVATGGDDGKVVATDAQGASEALASDAKHRWIDRVAIGPGALAWSAGKQAFARTGKGGEHAIEVGSTVGGLAFAPKGLRLAIAHYNGVTLWFPNLHADPEMLGWRGSHRDAIFSPDGRFVISSMQEPTLHGWRLADRKDMRMSGYAARVHSFGFTADGKWLATSGSNQLILWPFQGRDGPMGKTPRILARAESQAEIVACHPKQNVVAVGYADGLVLLVRVDDGAEILVRKPAGAPVTALAWNASGSMLAVAAEDGKAGLIDLG
jgi:Anaphase-promoting complex subunit 4 WD40 domain